MVCSKFLHTFAKICWIWLQHLTENNNKSTIDNRLRPRGHILMNLTKHCSCLDVQLVPPLGELLLNMLYSGPFAPWYENMTSSTKPELHNVSLCYHRRTESLPQAMCIKIGDIRPCGFWLMWADILVSILCTPPGQGRSNIAAVSTSDHVEVCMSEWVCVCVCVCVQLGRAPLHCAAAGGHSSVVDTLLSAAAALELTDKVSQSLSSFITVCNFFAFNVTSPHPKSFGNSTLLPLTTVNGLTCFVCY